jgi:hypothetical protein
MFNRVDDERAIDFVRQHSQVVGVRLRNDHFATAGLQRGRQLLHQTADQAGVAV